MPEKYKLLWPQNSNIYVYKGWCFTLLLLIIGVIVYEIVALLISDNLTEFLRANAFAVYVITIFLSIYIISWVICHG